MQLLDGLSKGEGQAVIVYSSDRLSRNYVDGIVLRDQWHRSGIELHYVAHGKSEDSFAGDLVDVVYALTAREVYLVIRSRNMNGRLEKSRSGKPVMSGDPPFGYRREGKGPDARYIKHEPELEVVQRIFHMYVHGENGSGPMALRGIAIQLQDEGIPSNRNRKILPSGLKEQLSWYPSTVRSILTNEIYIGRLWWGKTKSRKKGNKLIRKKRPREEWIEIPVPELAVIDPTTFQIAQDRAEKNFRLAKRNRKRNYLLAGPSNVAADMRW